MILRLHYDDDTFAPGFDHEALSIFSVLISALRITVSDFACRIRSFILGLPKGLPAACCVAFTAFLYAMATSLTLMLQPAE